MVHGSVKWNISDERGLHIIHQGLVQILREQPKKFLLLKDLVFLLNRRTRYHRIHNNKKHNSLTNYIKIKYGGIVKFLDDYSLYGIRIKDNRDYVYLMDMNNETLTDQELIDYTTKRITQDTEWVIVP
jgi:hypothetical protein